jgi:hypothetical protein
MKTRRKRFWSTTILASLFLVALIGGCKKDDYVEAPGLCPAIASTNPSDESINVAPDQVVTATFNKKMNPATFSQASFTLQGATKAGITVQGSVNYNEIDSTVSFAPAQALEAGTTYTATVKSTVKDSEGNALQTDYIWTFSTGATLSPTVIFTDPVNNATGVYLNATVHATFSLPMDPLTINTTTFTVKQGTTAVAGTIAYNGNTASFDPTTVLAPSTLYTATITTAAATVGGVTLQNNYTWTFTTGTNSGPSVVSTDPLNNATGVYLNKTVSAFFNMPMDPLTLTTTTFTLKQGLAAVAGTITYSGSTVSFHPADELATNTVYFATITTGAKNTAGNALANDYVWSFTTGDLSVPKVISTDPLNEATGVLLNKTVTASFSVLMDPSTITSTSFTVKQGTTLVAGTVSYSGTTASFDPAIALVLNTIYTATIKSTVKDLSGNTLESDYVWNFTTGSVLAPMVILTDPLNQATGVALNKVISATFSELMDPLTITTTSFTLMLGTTEVLGSVNYSGLSATFTPTVALVSGTYTATITNDVKNPAGIALANDYVWHFSTNSSIGSGVVNLKSVARFGIIAGVGISNNAGPSIINNLDIGIYPGVRSSVTGFPPATVVGGSIYASDDIAPPGVPEMLNQAKLDLVAAYLFAEGATSPAPATVSGDQGGKTLAPGIYKSTSTLLIQTGNLTLDAGGDVNAVWIFQIASDFTTVGGAGGSIILSGGAQAKNIFWQTGRSATLGDYTTFYGNILALTSITMNSHATAVGRMLARNGAVVMTHTNSISKP